MRKPINLTIPAQIMAELTLNSTHVVTFETGAGTRKNNFTQGSNYVGKKKTYTFHLSYRKNSTQLQKLQRCANLIQF